MFSYSIVVSQLCTILSMNIAKNKYLVCVQGFYTLEKVVARLSLDRVWLS